VRSTDVPDTIGTQLPSRELVIDGCTDARVLVELAVALEGDGADAVWVGESVVARPRFDTYCALAAVAVATDRVQLGSSVVLPALRSPVAFAHQVATIDQLAGGRLTVGVGGGFPMPATRHEFETLGVPYGRRVARLDATIEAARAIWGSSSDGSHAVDPTGLFGFADVTVAPPTHQRAGPPIWLATATEPGLQRCADAYDGWLPYPPSPAQYAEGLDRLRALATGRGRDPDSIAAGLYVTVATGPEAQEHMDEFCMRYYGLSAELVGLVQGCFAGTLECVAEVLQAYVRAGARHLVIRHATFDPRLVREESAALREVLRS
jgi:alkanesulfonate monooxygenase SsuD/methylene tetrahydromethanopterin reductase-like flavin-dependent oxidoreductase (luciferase family)